MGKMNLIGGVVHVDGDGERDQNMEQEILEVVPRVCRELMSTYSTGIVAREVRSAFIPGMTLYALACNGITGARSAVHHMVFNRELRIRELLRPPHPLRAPADRAIVTPATSAEAVAALGKEITVIYANDVKVKTDEGYAFVWGPEPFVFCSQQQPVVTYVLDVEPVGASMRDGWIVAAYRRGGTSLITVARAERDDPATVGAFSS